MGLLFGGGVVETTVDAGSDTVSMCTHCARRSRTSPRAPRPSRRRLTMPMTVWSWWTRTRFVVAKSNLINKLGASTSRVHTPN